MSQGLSAGLAAVDADPSARQRPPVVTRRRTIIFILGLVAYGVALIASLPARFAVDIGPHWSVAGTIWDGEAVLDGGYRVEWRWAPWRSLASFAYAADVRLTGNGSDIAGAATLVPHGYLLEGLSGRGDGALVAALVPSLPFTCETGLQIDLPRLRLSGPTSQMTGQVRADAGSCTTKGATDSSGLPALIATAAQADRGITAITIAPVGQSRRHLVDAAIANGRLTVTPTRDGNAVLPFLGGLRIDETL